MNKSTISREIFKAIQHTFSCKDYYNFSEDKNLYSIIRNTLEDNIDNIVSEVRDNLEQIAIKKNMFGGKMLTPDEAQQQYYDSLGRRKGD